MSEYDYYGDEGIVNHGDSYIDPGYTVTSYEDEYGNPGLIMRRHDPGLRRAFGIHVDDDSYLSAEGIRLPRADLNELKPDITVPSYDLVGELAKMAADFGVRPLRFEYIAEHPPCEDFAARNMPPSGEAFLEACDRWWPSDVGYVLEAAGVPPWGYAEQLAIATEHDLMVRAEDRPRNDSMQWGWGFYSDIAKAYAERAAELAKRIEDFKLDLVPYEINMIRPRIDTDAATAIQIPDWTTTPASELSFDDLAAAYARGELTSSIDEDGHLVIGSVAAGQRVSNEALAEMLRRFAYGGTIAPPPRSRWWRFKRWWRELMNRLDEAAGDSL